MKFLKAINLKGILCSRSLKHSKINTGLQQLIIVADAGLMSNKNLEHLLVNNYQFIIGARIKNETEKLQKQILAQNLKDGESLALVKTNNVRLIISYAASRAASDEH